MKLLIKLVTASCYLFAALVQSQAAVAAQPAATGLKVNIEKNYNITYKNTHAAYKTMLNVLQLGLYSYPKSPMFNCSSEGTSSDVRAKGSRFKCTEYPFGKTYEPSENPNWSTVKTLMQSRVPYSDSAGNSRNFYFQINAPRSFRPVVITDPLLGNLTEGQKTVNSVLGQQYVKNWIVDGKLYFEVCSLLPGMQVGGVPHSDNIAGVPVNNGDYTLKMGPFRDTVHFRLSPGTYSFDSFKFCFLMRVQKSTGNDKAIMVAASNPEISNISLAGTEINVSGVSMWTSIAASILGFFAAIFAFFKTGDIKMLLLSPLMLLAGAIQVVVGPFFNILESLVNRIVNKTIIPKFERDMAAQGENYFKSGQFNKDIVNVKLAEIVGSFAAVGSYESRNQKALMTHSEPLRVFAGGCNSLIAKITNNYSTKRIAESFCNSININLYEGDNNAAYSCQNSYMSVQSDLDPTIGNNCSFRMQFKAQAPESMVALYDCITDNTLNNGSNLNGCIPQATQFLNELNINSEALRLGLSGSLNDIAAAINLVRNNQSTFTKIEAFLKSIRRADYTPTEALAMLDKVVNQGANLDTLKNEILFSPEMISQVNQLYTEYFKRAPTMTEMQAAVNRLKIQSYQSMANYLAGLSRVQFAGALNKISYQMSNQAASSTEVQEFHRSWLNDNVSIDQIKVNYRQQVAYGSRIKLLLQKAYLSKTRRPLEESVYNDYAGRLAGATQTFSQLIQQMR